MDQSLKDFGKVMLRSPLYSWAVLFNGDGTTKNPGDLVKVYLEDPVFLEGLYWSSPQLYAQVLKMKAGTLKEDRESNLQHTLKKYLIRAATRPTPYGIFAGCCLKATDDTSYGEPPMQRKVRIDSGLLQNIKSRLESDPGIYPHLLYSLNNGLYSIPGQFRFTETIAEKGKWRYQLSSLDQSLLLHQLQSRMEERKLSQEEIFRLSETDVPFEVFSVFFKELLESQFLVSELLLSPTNEDELQRYTDVLGRLKAAGIAEAEKYLSLLLLLQATLQHFDKLPLGTLPLKAIGELNRQLDACNIPAHHEHLFHADLKKEPGNGFEFKKEKVGIVKKGVAILGALTENNTSPDDPLNRFIKLFPEKYGTRAIPVNEALDPEYGIGFPPREKIGDIAFNPLIEKITPAPENVAAGQNLLQNRAEALNGPSDGKEIRLTDEEVKEKKDTLSELPALFSVMGSMLPNGKILLEGVGKAHANSLPARFSWLDEDIRDLCNSFAEMEEDTNEDVIFAEIVFQPGGRVGNVVKRPPFFTHEIPVLASSAVCQEKQIPLRDLWVSVHGSEVILRSRKLKKRVIPRLSNAHNYSISDLPVYRFLASLQYGGNRGLGVDWGDFARHKRFLPRVVCDDIVLHRACWFLYRYDIVSVKEATDPVAALQMFLLKWQVPRLVSLSEGDNELFIDTANSEYLELLLKEIQNRQFLKLAEWPFGLPQAETGKEEAAVVQFILPLALEKPVPVSPFPWQEREGTLKEKFEPGSEWIYFKIYCSATFSDKILAEVVKPSIDSLLEKEVIKKAFFIRYTDPHYHIRFRLQLLRGDDKGGFAEAVRCVHDFIHPLSGAGIVWKLQMDTYERETERYGSRQILASEEVFFYDSLLYLDCLKQEAFSGNDETRFLAAVKNVDRWLALFNLPVSEKEDHCRQMCEKFSGEFGSVRYQVDQKYRELGPVAIAFLESTAFGQEFRERETHLRKLNLNPGNLASYIHMSINRWFLTEQRLMEYMCYLFCGKYYSQLLHHNQHKTR